MRDGYRRVVRDGVTVILGRPDLDYPRGFGVTLAKKFPPYVFSTCANASLIHKIERVELHWWEVVDAGHALARVDAPRMTAHSICGRMFYLGHRGRRGRMPHTCLVPSPDALLCGRCHGEVPTFRKGTGRAAQEGITRQAAGVRLGCVVKGY